MTKKQQARARKAEWNRAIREGRMVKFSTEEFMTGSAQKTVPQMTFRPYNSPAAAQLAVDAAIEDGVDATIVDPASAQ